nr:PREDICTED: mediator of RNA polymerase II transcription subunit 14 isoform X1 [Bemisia tabaci]
MAPIPLEGVQTPVGNSLPQEGNRGNSISLTVLIEFIIQRTYHELTVLAELLPRKTDMERKIEIFNFSARTRQLFVRLLALVKWANSASKVDKSAQIMGYLDKQSLLFVETADMLARVARETVVHARLPNFHIPAAIEVLTTGTYSRLPACIRDKIVPAEPITAVEKRSTLLRLNQVIQHRLVTSNLLPQMRNLKIEFGRVTFHVQNEFEVSLTIMGDGPNIPWRLLDIIILVQDKETGDGKSLVHPLQVQYIHQLLQARLVDHPNPLAEVYHCLHFFCQSLQLEVLYSQTLRLIRDRLEGLISVDEYFPGKCLAVSYWRRLTAEDPRSELGYKLTVLVDVHDPARPLSVQHVPNLSSKESEITDKAIRSELLSMERLLVHTIYVRTKSRLIDLKTELQTILKDVECVLQGSPAILAVSVLTPCLRAEQLLITVDTHTGVLHCHVPQHKPPVIPDLQNALNSDHTRIPSLVSELRYWMTQRRCEKTLQHLPVTVHEKLPLLFHLDHPMTRISRHRMFITFHKHPNVILIVELKEKESCACEVDCKFYLALMKHSAVDEDAQDESIETEIPKLYLKLQTLIQLDNFLATHGPFTSVDEQQADKLGVKRKNPGGKIESSPKRTRHPAYFIPELAHVVALCDERMPFVSLAQELTNQNVAHQGVQGEACATTQVLKLLQLPSPTGIDSSSVGWRSLLKRMLSVSLRTCAKGAGRCWMAEFVFYGSPVVSTYSKEQGMRRPVYFQYEMSTPEKTVEHLLNDWARIVHLYTIVEELAEYFKTDKYAHMAGYISIKSFSYCKLVFCYGPQRLLTANIQWNTQDKAFSLIFGTTNNALNPHTIVRAQMEAFLNRTRNLAQLIHMLVQTYQPLLSLSKLPTMPQLGAHNSRPQVPVVTFTVVPISAQVVRVVYLGFYCLELRFEGDDELTIRDGAYSRFDRTNVINDFLPTPGLKAFLSKYIVEGAAMRRHSKSEDDNNPPSPVSVDPTESSGLRFQHPLTPPSGSNPHTPASPHPTSISQQQHPTYTASPATSFSLASPPSSINPSPSMLAHASPGSALAPSPMPTSSPGPGPIGLSPASSFMPTGHNDGSPFPSTGQNIAASPASNWPGSPSMPRSSPARPVHTALHSPDHKTTVTRQIPTRVGVGSVPSVLTYEALDVICSPSPFPQGLPGPSLCPLERFLGCVYMRRHLQRSIQTEENVSRTLIAVPCTEPGVVHFKVETLQCRVMLNSQHLQSLHIKISPTPEHPELWNADDLLILEKFFDTRAAAAPYKPNAILGFARMLNVSYNVLKDFISIMRLELVPGLVQQNGLKWAVQWSLTIPGSATPIVPTGMAAIIICRNKILFFLQITRVGVNWEAPSLVLPLVYDTTTNITQLAEKRDAGPATAASAASLHMKRFSEFNVNLTECSIFPAVRDLLANFTLPSENLQMAQSPSQGPSPVVGPNQGQMHSPMSGVVGMPPNQVQGPGGIVGGPGPPQGYPVSMPPMGPPMGTMGPP